MKNNLLEILMDFFEQRLTQLAEKKMLKDTMSLSVNQDTSLPIDNQLLILQQPNTQSLRVFTLGEQTKFTKASYQFIMRMLLWQIIEPVHMELILNQLECSDSTFVTLSETKSTIRYVLADHVDAHTLALLDTILYQEEDRLTQH